MVRFIHCEPKLPHQPTLPGTAAHFELISAATPFELLARVTIEEVLGSRRIEESKGFFPYSP
jgi:hypothetical protein